MAKDLPSNMLPQERMAAVFLQYREELLGFIRKLMPFDFPDTSAEDIYQNSVMRALQAHGYEQETSEQGFKNYAYQVVRSVVYNTFRYHKYRRFSSLDTDGGTRDEPETLEVADSAPNPLMVVLALEENSVLKAAIAQLEPDEQALLYYKMETELSNLEIGQQLKRSESAIKSFYFRTLTKLRKILEGKKIK